MPYDDQAEEHERLMQLLFTLRRRYDDCPVEDVERRALLLAVIAQIEDDLERIRQRHRS